MCLLLLGFGFGSFVYEVLRTQNFTFSGSVSCHIYDEFSVKLNSSDTFGSTDYVR